MIFGGWVENMFTKGLLMKGLIIWEFILEILEEEEALTSLYKLKC